MYNLKAYAIISSLLATPAFAEQSVILQEFAVSPDPVCALTQTPDMLGMEHMRYAERNGGIAIFAAPDNAVGVVTSVGYGRVGIKADVDLTFGIGGNAADPDNTRTITRTLISSGNNAALIDQSVNTFDWVTPDGLTTEVRFGGFYMIANGGVNSIVEDHATTTLYITCTN